MATKYIVTAPGVSVNHPKYGFTVRMLEGTIFTGDQFSGMSGIDTYTGTDPADYNFYKPGGVEIDFEVADTESDSTAVNMHRKQMFGIRNPAAVAATTAGWAILRATAADGTFALVRDIKNNPIVLPFTASEIVTLDSVLAFVGTTYLKLRAVNSSNVAVPQTADIAGQIIAMDM